jgi:DNA-binding CsgD family transcriptional regulator
MILHKPIYLSERKLEVLHLISKGYTMKEIGDILFVSEYTVITHKRNLLSKFRAKNTAHLISIVYQLKVLAVKSQLTQISKTV